MIFNRTYLNYATPVSDPYLTFSSPTSFKIYADDLWDGTIEYSTDTSTWNEWSGSGITSQKNNDTYYIYMRGTNNTNITYGNDEVCWSIEGRNVSCIGNIENLLDYNTVASGLSPEMGEGCFACLFYDMSALISTPSLPATTLSKNCYSRMFYNCTSLTTAPELPATTLADYCYSYMFSGCTSLTTAPELPATTLASNCYRSMFYGCASLMTAPELPATTLSPYCYCWMFEDCKTLSGIPELPATSLPDGCYTGMFHNCELIKLSSTQTETYTNGYRIPSSGTGTVGSNSLSNMFSGTSGTFAGTPTINTTYYSFSASNLDYLCFTANTAGSTIKANIASSQEWSRAIYYSTDKEVWKIMYCEVYDDESEGYEVISNTINLSSAGDLIYVKGNFGEDSAEDGEITFIMTGSIAASGNVLSIMNDELICDSSYKFCGLFYNQTSLTSSPKFPLGSDYPYSCLENVFLGCTSLSSIPIFPEATSISDEDPVINNIFSGCSNIGFYSSYSEDHPNQWRFSYPGYDADEWEELGNEITFSGVGDVSVGIPNVTYYTNATIVNYE